MMSSPSSKNTSEMPILQAQRRVRFKCHTELRLMRDCVLLKATLAEYRSFQNEPVSYLNRVTVLENKGSIK